LLTNAFINTLIQYVKKNKNQIFKFVIVGLLSSFLNFISYIFIYSITRDINLSSLTGYSLGLLNSFYFSSNWVFPGAQKFKLNKAFLLFLLIYCVGGIQMTLTINFVDKIIENYKFAWLCGAFIASVNNYLGSKYVLFRN